MNIIQRRQFALVVLCFTSFTCPLLAQNRGYESENFVVYASDPAFAQRVAQLAEKYRKELAEKWLGHELEPWRDQCPIVVQFDAHAGGETSFGFVNSHRGRGEPIDWQMKIYGPPNRLLDSVLPHEVTHTVFATHFGCPLPRWADEGACTTVEHESEKSKSQEMLIRFLKTRRGIPFNRMFVMREYPADILPLYAQGHSVAQFLIQKNGCRHFIDFVGFGMDLERQTRGRKTAAWDQAINKFYGFKDLSDLQVTWTSWVGSGSPQQAGNALANNKVDTQDTAVSRQDTISENRITELNRPARPYASAMPAGRNVSHQSAQWQNQNPAKHSEIPGTLSRSYNVDSWYSRQIQGNSDPKQPTSGTDLTFAVPPSNGNAYRPGSIANAQSFEQLRAQGNVEVVGAISNKSTGQPAHSTSRQTFGQTIYR